MHWRRGAEPDYSLAAGWYRKAAEQGFVDAQLRLGQLYEQGTGVPRDSVTAMAWYLRASDQGQSGAGIPLRPDIEILEPRIELIEVHPAPLCPKTAPAWR